MKKFLVIILFVCSCAFIANAQGGSQTRPKVVPTPTPTPAPTPKAETTDNTKGTTQVAYTPKDPVAKEVLAVFDKILKGIRNVNVDDVTNAYWNSPQLTLYNYNGTVTRGWEQMRKNREASFAETKDVVLDARDVRVQLMGKDGAVVMYMWTQSQTFRDKPETSTGRTTLIFRRVVRDWKVIQVHVSPDNPDKSRVPASEEPKQ